MTANAQWFIGLVGAGNISETHARAAAALPGVTIAAVHGTNLQKTRRLAQQYLATAYDDFSAFLAHRPMSFVILGSPSGLHAEQGIAAAAHELHVLTEKPIDISIAKADALIAAARRHNVKVATIFQDRTKPHIRQLKSWLDQGLVGRPLFVDAHLRWYRPPEYYSRSRWRGTLALDGGGALINQGIHTIDLLLWLLGDVVRVQARTATLLHNIEVEDTAAALLEFQNGALATFYTTTAAYPGFLRRIEISGTEGSVILENDRILSANFRNAPETPAAALDAPDQNASASSAAVADVRAHQAVIQDFLDAIAHDRQPLCDGCEARRSLDLVESIYSAAKFR
jgi:UDP-N-acetyl-2-amino-2-deoxyglucuronate dehydrogenase